MLNPFVSCLVFGIEMPVAYLFFSRCSEKRYSLWKCLLIGILLFECGSLVNLISQHNVLINTIFSFLIHLTFAVICFEITPLVGISYGILIVVLNFSLELIAALIYAPFMKTNSVDVNQNPYLLVLVVLTSKTLLLVVCLLISRLIKPHASKIPMAFLCYPAALGVCLWICWEICLLDQVTRKMQRGITAVCVIFFATTVGLFLVYLHQIEENDRHLRTESELRRLQVEKSYYEILEQQNENLMIYAHDTKKQLAALQAITDEAEIQQYVQSLSEQLKTYSNGCHSGNKFFDVMIHKYKMDCEAKGISFQYDVRQWNLSEITDLDLVAIVGNLMDNAVKAAAESTKKQIIMETTYRNCHGVLIVCNSSDTAPRVKGKQLLSVKTEPGFHGFGIKSAVKALKRYHGFLNWEYDENTHNFVVTVMAEVQEPSEFTKQ